MNQLPSALSGDESDTGNMAVNRDTNPVVLIRCKTEKLRKDHGRGREDLQSAYVATSGAAANKENGRS